MKPKTYTATEVAKFLGVTSETVHEWVDTRPDAPRPFLARGAVSRRGRKWHARAIPEWRRWYERHRKEVHSSRLKRLGREEGPEALWKCHVCNKVFKPDTSGGVKFYPRHTHRNGPCHNSGRVIPVWYLDPEPGVPKDHPPALAPRPTPLGRYTLDDVRDRGEAQGIRVARSGRVPKSLLIAYEEWRQIEGL